MAWLYDKPPSWAAEMIDYIERQAIHEEIDVLQLRIGLTEKWSQPRLGFYFKVTNYLRSTKIVTFLRKG